MKKKSMTIEIKEQEQKNNIEIAIRAVLKMQPVKGKDNKMHGVIRKVRPTHINAMVTVDGRMFIYPYLNIDEVEAKYIINGAPAAEIFADGREPDYLINSDELL